MEKIEYVVHHLRFSWCTWGGVGLWNFDKHGVGITQQRGMNNALVEIGSLKKNINRNCTTKLIGRNSKARMMTKMKKMSNRP